MRTAMIVLVVAAGMSVPTIAEAGGPRGYARAGYGQGYSYSGYSSYGSLWGNSHEATLRRVQQNYQHSLRYGNTHPRSRYQYSGNRGYDFRAGVNRFGEYYENYRTRR